MSIRAFLRRHRPRTRGQSLVEFALLLPVFLVIVSAALDLGRIAYARVSIANVAREAAFQAASTPTSYQAGQPCSSSNPSANMVICRALLESKGSVVTVTPSDITMTCSPDCTKAMGNTVTVKATGRFNLLTPLMSAFFGGTSITFSSSWMMMKAVGMVSRSSRVVASTKRPMPSSSDRSIYLSTPPMIGSRLAMTAMVSATRWPGMSTGITCRLTKLGSRMRNRYGVGPPSLMA